MKKVIGVILIILVMSGIGFLLFMEFNKENLVYSGDYLTNSDNYSVMVTRAYVSDESDRSQIAAILETVFTSPELTAEEIAGAATGYGTVLYAPVFNVSFDKPNSDDKYFTISGTVQNGISENGESVETAYVHRNLRLDAIIDNGVIEYASNAVKPEELIKKEYTLPVVTEEGQNAAFKFDDSNGFEIVFSKADINADTKIVLLYTFSVDSSNPVDFSGLEREKLQLEITFTNDENEILKPSFLITKVSEIQIEQTNDNQG